MPLLETDYDQRFILVEESTTVADAVALLREKEGADDWHIFIKRDGNIFGVIQVNALKQLLVLTGPNPFAMPLAELHDKIPNERPVDPASIGLGTAQDWARHSASGALVIVRQDQVVVGRFVLEGEADRGGEDVFPDASLIQLYRNYMTGTPDDTTATEGGIHDWEIAESSKVVRYTNLCVTRHGEEECLPKATTLGAGNNYDLRLNIGPFSPDTVVDNAGQHPFPAECLPPSEAGHWLEVAAVSDDFIVSAARNSLFLPTTGASWICDCPPGDEHTCSETMRKSYLYLPLKTPSQLGNASLRVAIYYQNNLIQSLRLTAEVAAKERVEAERNHLTAIVDYSLTADLADVSFLQPRTLNILTNENAGGTHKIVVKNGADEIVAFNLTEGQMGITVNAAREALRNVHFEEYGGQLGSQRQRRNLLDKNNGKSKADFITDLKRLAPLGWQLWHFVLSGESEMWPRLHEPSSIQVCRTGGNAFVFPWALLYDMPLELDKQYKTCKLVEQWDNAQELIDSSTRRCPFESEHEPKNMLCPFGFWGLKHIIEQPPSMPKHWKLPLMIRVQQSPADLVMGISRQLDQSLTTRHIQALKGRLAQFEVQECDSLPAVVAAMANPVGLVYFYCHGRREAVPGTNQETPYLELGKSEQFRPSDITVWRMADWPPQHWQDSTPLVFINGCHTAELTPESLVSFVDAFTTAYASGVIGTEITLDQLVANEAAEQFLSHFQGNGTTVGQALHRMRLEFLLKGNLLGLAYTPYCSASLKLSGN